MSVHRGGTLRATATFLFIFLALMMTAVGASTEQDRLQQEQQRSMKAHHEASMRARQEHERQMKRHSEMELQGRLYALDHEFKSLEKRLNELQSSIAKDPSDKGVGVFLQEEAVLKANLERVRSHQSQTHHELGKLREHHEEL